MSGEKRKEKGERRREKGEGSRRAGALAVLILALAATAASAQSPDDLKAYGDYRLNIENYQQYLDASINLLNVAVMDPILSKRLHDLGTQPVAEQIKQLNGVPEARGAISRTGLTTRDYVLVQGAALQAGRAHTQVKNGKLSLDLASKKPGVSRANLEFYNTNEARIASLLRDYEMRKPKT
jgi:hypothetical protein